MKGNIKAILAGTVISAFFLTSYIGVFAAGYEVVLETDITYEKNSYNTTDEDGEYAEITEISNLLSNFSNGYAIVYEKCKIIDTYFMHLITSESQYIINSNGQRVSVPAFDVTSGPHYIFNDTAYDTTYGRGLDNFGGTTVVNSSCEENSFYPEEYLYGYVGIADGVTIPCIYEDVVTRCNNNVFRVGSFGSYTYIDKDGNKVPEPDSFIMDDGYEQDLNGDKYFSTIGRHGLYIVSKDGKYGIVNKNEETVVPFEYDKICGLQSGYCWVAKNGKWSLYKLSKDSIVVTVNKNTITFDQNPLVINGRTLAPVRAIFEALGATVEWNNDTREVTSTKDGTTIVMTIDNTTMYKNGEAIVLDVAPQIIGERTLVPVRAIAEAFNCIVEWDNDTQTVIITQ